MSILNIWKCMNSHISFKPNKITRILICTSLKKSLLLRIISRAHALLLFNYTFCFLIDYKYVVQYIDIFLPEHLLTGN